jgi:glucokinase
VVESFATVEACHEEINKIVSYLQRSRARPHREPRWRRGRDEMVGPGVELSSDPSGGTRDVVLALDFGGSKIAAAIVPASGGPALAQDVARTVPELGAQANFELAVALGKRIIGVAPLAAVGACTFGIPRDDGVALSPAIEGWNAFPLRRRLDDAFGVPVDVVTDVKAAARAEVRHGALVGADPAIYVNLGTGLAVALVFGGTVVVGAHGASGEIGYNLLRGDDPGRVLEDVVSGMGLARALADRSRPGDAEGIARTDHRTGADASRVAALFDGSGTDDSVRRAVLGEFFEELCFQMVNLVVAVDPERVAVGGGFVRSWDQIEAPLRLALERHVPYPPELVRAAYPFDAALRGAIDLGVDLARSRRDSDVMAG